MARSDWIMPRAEKACGKVFLPSRKAAEEHRIALQYWVVATRHGRMDYRLTTYRCPQCGGFHIGRKKLRTSLSPLRSDCLSSATDDGVQDRTNVASQ